MGLGTRTELKKEIRSGSVTVDGRTVTDPGFRITGSPAVVYRGEPVAYEEFVYYMMNKPSGVISASEDRFEDTVVDLIAEPRRKDIFPVGRLDRDTTGLLIITNDGELAHRLLSPKHHVDKLYRARISGIACDDDIEAFRGGLILADGLHCLPAELSILSVDEAAGTSEVEVVIREGKFRQVKRMFLAVGKEVTALRRLSMGPLELDPSLGEGEYRRLTDEELTLLKEAVRATPAM
jgi:16S rRNA pseudouridine516 synthase